ncbi:MAG: thiamine-phosphate kinase [Verrucomicrobia bacterium]|nr:thiamine-phosphate kinase [Verrucomicrobiota bacterium]
MNTLIELGERTIISRLRERLATGQGVIHGIGDDCAVVRTAPSASEDLLLTSDALIEGRHFLPTDPPANVGAKAVGRALSDIAAMGGQPRWGLVDLVAPPTYRVADLDALYDGMQDLAAKHQLTIVGGDTTQGSPLELHIFAVGVTPRDQAILRSGARPDDVLFVTGSLGGSRAGRHLRFEPRVAEGQWLRGRATAMIDISDGLATDLRHILAASRLGACIDAHCIPISPEAAQANDDRSPLDHALTDGEDFELLFTVPQQQADAFFADWAKAWPTPCTRIGRLTTAVGEIQIRNALGHEAPLKATGFEHFHTFQKRTA